MRCRMNHALLLLMAMLLLLLLCDVVVSPTDRVLDVMGSENENDLTSLGQKN
jgi:hypothetical protein